MSVLVVFFKGSMSHYLRLNGVFVSIGFSLRLFFLSYGAENIFCRSVVTDAKDENGVE